jgi:hypothetical protein
MHLGFRRAARFAAVATLPLVFMAAQPVADGMSYEFVMKSTSKATGNKETVTMRGRGTYAGDDAKIELLEASSATGGTEAWGGKGTYFIVKNGGKDMLLVNPAEKTYMKWDMMAMMAGLGKAMNAVGGLVKMQVSDVKIDAQDMGAGPSVQGYATRHFRMVQNYTVSASVFGKTSKTRSETTTDYYIAPTLKIANPFVMNAQTTEMMGQFDMFNTPDYKNQMAAANAKMPKTGVPLRMETKMVSTDEKGKAETSTSVMEMTNFKAGNIPASTFEIPSDYKMVEMPNMAGGNGQNAVAADSASAKKTGDPAKDAAAAAGAKLKGLFGGKKK